MSNLIDSYVETKTEIDGKWYIAKPIIDKRWKVRIIDAFFVLTGKCEAVYFKEVQEVNNVV